MKKFVQFLFLAIFISSCSQYNTGIISKGWHNLNAKYNSLLLARADYKYANQQILEYGKENYSTILPVFPKIDSTKLDSAKYLLLDAIKNTSLIAERHSNSKYLDEAYIILGKARLKKQETFNAIETFKYVNTKSKSAEKQNEALIWLFRAYIENEDFSLANQVANVLVERDLNDKNKGLFLTTKAYYHQKLNEDALALVFLEESLKYYAAKTREKARLSFIVAQYYDKFNNPVMAKKYYQNTLKNNPYYDLEFNAKMGLKMNQSLAYESNSLFEDMLQDRKNQDLLDKIYFKMGELETQKRHYDQAIKFYSKAALLSDKDLVQKAYSYKAIGDIYFEKLNNLESGATYYDSTLISIPKNMEEYKILSQKAMVYNDFIRYYKIYELEDSLQALAALNPVDLDKKLTQIVENNQNATKAKSLSTLAKSASSSLSGTKWIFYDRTEYINNKNEFIRIWGNRELQDNWRQGNKSASTGKTAQSDSFANSQNKDLKSTASEDEEKNKEAIEGEKVVLLSKIPLTPSQMAASKRKQETAYFQLGKIYRIQFKDIEKSNKTFKSFLEKFPNSVFEPEVLYFLSLDADANSTYRKELIEKFPRTSFARQIQKGAQKITKDQESESHKVYADAFELYEKQEYTQALNLLDDALLKFMGSQIEDKIALLRIMIQGKMGNKDIYVSALNDFMRNYPSSELIINAKRMLDAVNQK